MAVAHCFAALHRARGAIQVTLRPLPVHEVPPQELTYINKHGLVKTRSVSNAIFYHLLAFHSIVLCGAVLIQVHSTPGTSRSPGFGREHEGGSSRKFGYASSHNHTSRAELTGQRQPSCWTKPPVTKTKPSPNETITTAKGQRCAIHSLPPQSLPLSPRALSPRRKTRRPKMARRDRKSTRLNS